MRHRTSVDTGFFTTSVVAGWGVVFAAYDPGYVHPVILVALGRHDEALSHLLHVEAKASHPALSTWYASLRGALSASYDEAAMACERTVALNVPDPESLYHMARTLAYCKRSSRALDLFNRTVDEGYFNVALFERDPWVDTLRGDAQIHGCIGSRPGPPATGARAFARAGGHLVFAARPVS